MSITSNTIEAAEKDYLYIQESLLLNAGKGLFTAITIYKGETIAIFEGEILDQKETSRRAKLGQDQYFLMMLDGTTLDSKKTFCYAKYANDVKGSAKSLHYKNNAKLRLDENDKVCLQAKTKIESGSEIFVSYGKQYWTKHSQVFK
jgi:hypothetical protein